KQGCVVFALFEPEGTTTIKQLMANVAYHFSLQADDYFLIKQDEARKFCPEAQNLFAAQMSLLLAKLRLNDVAIVLKSGFQLASDLSTQILACQLAKVNFVAF